ncbi:cytochrome b/b6 domain-containing protein [Haladaptatus salinisoli]|uniref:cytochrome b/b6 domain-containing protein n=1 Tax=Haladaptatus salinisoli TaxID=2884876 RepID=UPI001D0AA077|nr:cytochrome b/b6 domain-containing protein [Haladaptatus salinisoli]
MTNLDHGKFARVTTIFHSLLALDVFALFFTGYAVMFNDELWWLIELMGGSTGVLAVHRLAGMTLVALTSFWIALMVLTPGGRGSFREVIPSKVDIDAMIQDVRFALGRADERHPNARQFSGYTAEDAPLLTYVGKGVIWIFSIELFLLMISGLLIWSKTGLIQIMATKTAAMAFVVFHGLLGVIMLMGVMFHIYEHGFHPAFYPVELKAFIPQDITPSYHGDSPEGTRDKTGIDRLALSPSWKWIANLMGVFVVVGIVSVLIGSIFDEGYPVPRELAVGGGPTNVLLTIGINIGILVLFVGLVLSMYGNVLRRRYEQQVRKERRETPMADGQGDD